MLRTASRSSARAGPRTRSTLLSHRLEDLELAVHKGLKGELAGELLSLFGKRLIISITTAARDPR